MPRLCFVSIVIVALFLDFAGPCASATLADVNAAFDKGDYRAALKVVLPLAENGDADAQAHLGYMYENGLGMPQNNVRAFEWYRKAAEQGNAGAQNNIGGMYLKGEVVQQDLAEALKWYRRSAQQGYASAESNLGVLYYSGQGVPQSFSEALQWYQKAAEKGYAPAQAAVAHAYATGEGRPKDYGQALQWYQKAANQGYVFAQRSLGLMYLNGQGVSKDLVRAYSWLNAAAGHGDRDAAIDRDRIETTMSPEQIVQAQNLTAKIGSKEWGENPRPANIELHASDRERQASMQPFCLPNAELNTVLIPISLRKIEALLHTCLRKYADLRVEGIESATKFNTKYAAEISKYEMLAKSTLERHGLTAQQREQTYQEASEVAIRLADRYSEKECHNVIFALQAFTLVDDFKGIKTMAHLDFQSVRPNVPICTEKQGATPTISPSQ